MGAKQSGGFTIRKVTLTADELSPVCHSERSEESSARTPQHSANEQLDSSLRSE
jgi:hypothetical protein